MSFIVQVLRYVTGLAIIVGLWMSSGVHAATDVASTDTDRMFNIRVNAPAYLLGGELVAADVKILDALTIGPYFAYREFTLFDLTWTATGFGVSANWHFNGQALTSGAYLRPYVGYKTETAVTLTSKGIITGGAIGYRWYLENGINFGLGGGLSYYFGPTDLSSSSSGFTAIGKLSDLGFELDVNIGFAF